MGVVALIGHYPFVCTGMGQLSPRGGPISHFLSRSYLKVSNIITILSTYLAPLSTALVLKDIHVSPDASLV